MYLPSYLSPLSSLSFHVLHQLVIVIPAAEGLNRSSARECCFRLGNSCPGGEERGHVDHFLCI